MDAQYHNKEEPSTAQLVVKDQVRRRGKTTTPPPPGNGKKSLSPSSEMTPYTPPQRGEKRPASLLEGEGSSTPPTKKAKWSSSPKIQSIARRMFAALRRKKIDPAPKKMKKCHFERNNIRGNLKIKYPSSRALGSPKSFSRMRRTRSIPLSQQQIPLLQGRNDILLTTSDGETTGN